MQKIKIEFSMSESSFKATILVEIYCILFDCTVKFKKLKRQSRKIFYFIIHTYATYITWWEGVEHKIKNTKKSKKCKQVKLKNVLWFYCEWNKNKWPEKINTNDRVADSEIRETAQKYKNIHTLALRLILRWVRKIDFIFILLDLCLFQPLSNKMLYKKVLEKFIKM